MRDFARLLRDNPNYRWTWLAQVVSEIGDNFNNVAVFALVMKTSGSGLVVSGVMLARAVAMIAAGPVAGVLLDRMDRRRLMVHSDLARAIIALLFVLTIGEPSPWLLYLLSAALMFASPFFTSGRSAILPVIASEKELHTANSLTQTTQWTSVALGSLLGGASTAAFGYKVAFLFNAASFVISAICILRLRPPAGARFQARREDLTETRIARPWAEYVEGLRYMRATPLVLAIALIGVGWATGGGASQILFSLFGDQVFGRGAAGIGEVWSAAGFGLIAGGLAANAWGRRLRFETYKWVISGCYIIHGATYVLFSRSDSYAAALLFIGLSRASVAVSSVLNFAQLLRHVPDAYRGRVFSTMESMVWGTMMVSMLGAGLATKYHDPRWIGTVAGCASSTTALFWAWANWRGKLPEPAPEGVEPEEVEVHGESNA